MGGVFSNDGEMYETKVSKCKRDYESEIARVKQNLNVTSRLRGALIEYLETHGYGHQDQTAFTLPSLYGSLALSEKRSEKAILQLQEAWENDK